MYITNMGTELLQNVIFWNKRIFCVFKCGPSGTKSQQTRVYWNKYAIFIHNFFVEKMFCSHTVFNTIECCIERCHTKGFVC